jgi:hypothetical protein
MPLRPAARTPKAEGWLHPLKSGNLEVFLKVVDRQGETLVKLRASGPESEMGELIDWFERVTGTTVDVPETRWRLKRGPREIRGQLWLLVLGYCF